MEIQDILASDDHVVIIHEAGMTMGGRSTTARFADVYRVRDHRLAEHWHLAFDPKADAELMVG
jgi:predicted SnoaL-like aldol condensation-catalyzing enzyme